MQAIQVLQLTFWACFIYISLATGTADNENYNTTDEKLDKKDKKPCSSKNATQTDEFSDLVRVNSNGEVRSLHLNPTEAEDNESPIEVIPKKKVVSGKTSNLGAVPYQINIARDGKSICGGVIYNSLTVLSAAHCFHRGKRRITKDEIQQLRFVAGEFKLDEVENSEQPRLAEEVFIHPDYIPLNNFNDIAVIKLKKPFVYDKFVQPLPIDRCSLVTEDAPVALISGWGYTQMRQPNSDKSFRYYPNALQEAKVKIFKKDECLGFYNGRSFTMIDLINAGLICAGQVEGTVVDTCQGDSGGPLACYNPLKGNRRFLCGLVATGIGCGLPGSPGLYTKVADFHKWIIENAGECDKRTIDDKRDTID